MFRDQRVFLQQFFRQYHTTGSVLPSSRALARALCRFVENPHAAAHNTAANGDATVPTAGREILEVGPGTGAVTARLVTAMKPNDRLTLVELNDDFVAHLRKRFETEPDFQAVAARSNIVHARLEDLPGERCYQAIISGLPLNNFEVPEVEQILGIFQRLLSAEGTLSFFEYIAIRRAKALVSGREGRARLNGIGAVLNRTLTGREIKRDWVWPNVPPAWVHHVRFGEMPS
jgi:phosphatidylethanolamine/phosphatidyl-N-methylethanolamine N-methyltransferase